MERSLDLQPLLMVRAVNLDAYVDILAKSLRPWFAELTKERAGSSYVPNKP